MAKTVETKELTEVSEAQIAVHWKEEEYYQPSEKFKAQANLRDPHVFAKFGLDKFPDCFKTYADMLTWFQPYHTVLDTSDAPVWKWFVGGKINAAYNCVARHLAKYWRNGTLVDHKANADIAVRAAKDLGQDVDKVLVWQRYPGRYSAKTQMVSGRDVFVNDLLKDYKGKNVEPVALPSEGPLFLMYSSGTTGKPKGAQHGIAGYLAYVTGTSKWHLDIHPEDIYWCMADIGWITGHSYIVYGPLAIAATSVLYEGVPTFPDAGRPWRIAERLGVNIFHTAPTAIRMLRKLGPQEPRKYKYHFKSMTTVGEPIEPEAWRWYYDEVGKREAVITDTWWMTETGGFLGTTVPAIHAMKPGSCGPGAPGIHPVIYDETGAEVPKGSGKAGNICIRNPCRGSLKRTWATATGKAKPNFPKYNRNPKTKNGRTCPSLCD